MLPRLQENVSEYVTTDALLHRINELTFPNLTPTERKNITLLHTQLKKQKAQASPGKEVFPTSLELQAAYELNKDREDISPKIFAEVIKAMQVVEAIVKYYQQIGMELRRQVGNNFGADQYMSVSDLLLSKKDRPLLQAIPESIYELSEGLQKLGFVSADQNYWLVTIAGAASAAITSKQAESLEQLSDESGPTPVERSVAATVERREQVEEEMRELIEHLQEQIEEENKELIKRLQKQVEEEKKELIKHLQEMASIYKNLKNGKGEHTERIQLLTKNVKEAATYEEALHVVENALLEQKRRYEQGRFFSFLHKVPIYKLTKLNFGAKLMEEGNTFLFPKLLTGVVQREHQKHPDKAHPALFNFAKKMQPPVHEHYEPTLAWLPQKKADNNKMRALAQRITGGGESTRRVSLKRASPAEANIIAYRLVVGQDSVEEMVKKVFPNLKQELADAIIGNRKAASPFYLKDSELNKILNKLFATGMESAIAEVSLRRKERLGVGHLGAETDRVREVLSIVLEMRKGMAAALTDTPEQRKTLFRPPR